MQFPVELLSQCWFLCGPTASGKTAVSIELARRLNAEIISLDSMTLYRGMDIGTAKPTREQREDVPHHLIDILDPHEECSLADYTERAKSACHNIVCRGRRPLFVGGTGLYLRGILRGVFEGPAADWDLRQSLEKRILNEGPESLHLELQQFDPTTAARLHSNDVRRVIRAIEVFRLTGKPLSQQHEQKSRPVSERTPHVYWLSPPREWLYDRINLRVDQMFEQGLLQEVRQLTRLIQPLSHTARQALGYKEVLDWLGTAPTNADIAPSELIDLIQTRTRQFAKRQHTWFRNLEECIPIPINGDETPSGLADAISARS